MVDAYNELRGEIKKQMTIKGIKNYQELADLTGYSKQTICGFMNAKRYSEHVDKKIREVLGISDKIKT